MHIREEEEGDSNIIIIADILLRMCVCVCTRVCTFRNE